ncbi:Hypothetical protein SFBmNL_01510 [Candidatus Arthromitus sp. SFB-mouse-NL]|uniref:helix-turn-helix transcriptional regulator n=1 Tax=Candidatus Arthromitus sp. SFB-mouse-NL TaxID=1508644 RepID=UPI000499DBCC|nr:helix-turn-helix transcriptional regulator [Candidatus Arthromitus sp. SFB-mouse-NL]AID45409.1 Hypothetical protein SFBmNL_01510 [Candidatus Arthromitus sp. SFB-mouse-NL]
MFLSLRNLRKKKGLTLEDAAIKLKIKKMTLSDYESGCGDRTFNFIIVDKLAVVYNVTYTDIIYACKNKSINKNLNYGANYEEKTLKELRECVGLNVKEACTKLEIARSTLLRYEKSELKPTSNTIYKMHLVYNLSCEDIVNACFKTFKFEKYQK